jgi:sec-independent protein translocase protein TatC
MEERPRLDQIEEVRPFVPYSENEEAPEMPFLDHLEELRWHIIRSVLSIFIFTLVAFFSKKFIFGTLILGPSQPSFWTYRQLCRLGDALNVPDLCVKELDFALRSRDLGEQFTMHLTSSLIIGLICAFPYTFWEVWRFVKPGLHTRERRAASGATFFVSVLFAIGVSFGYFIVSPLTIQFLANYKLDESIINQFDLSSYIGVLAGVTLACGIMFQLPMVAFVLSQAGILTPAFLKTYRRHSVVVILVLAAVITPSPDVLSQLLVAMPLFLLYELSIGVSAMVWRRKRAEELKD